MSDENRVNDCIFCSIVADAIPSRTVYETDSVLAFLDVNPLAPGHLLVIPKAHYETIGDLPDDLTSNLFDALGMLIPIVENAVDADASTVGFNNGEASGQEIPHLHGHVIPRFVNDGGRPLHAVAGSPPQLSEEELDDITIRIRELL